MRALVVKRWTCTRPLPRCLGLYPILPALPRQQYRLGSTVVALAPQIRLWEELHRSQPGLLFILAQSQSPLPDLRLYSGGGQCQRCEYSKPDAHTKATGEHGPHLFSPLCWGQARDTRDTRDTFRRCALVKKCGSIFLHHVSQVSLVSLTR